MDEMWPYSQSSFQYSFNVAQYTFQDIRVMFIRRLSYRVKGVNNSGKQGNTLKL